MLPRHGLNEIVDVDMLCKLLITKVSSSILLCEDIILSGICVCTASVALNGRGSHI